MNGVGLKLWVWFNSFSMYSWNIMHPYELHIFCPPAIKVFGEVRSVDSESPKMTNRWSYKIAQMGVGSDDVINVIQTCAGFKMMKGSILTVILSNGAVELLHLTSPNIIWFPKDSIFAISLTWVWNMFSKNSPWLFCGFWQITPKEVPHEFSTLCYFSRIFLGILSFIKQYSQIFQLQTGGIKRNCCRNLSNNETMCYLLA